jgi:hypothetical protein
VPVLARGNGVERQQDELSPHFIETRACTAASRRSPGAWGPGDPVWATLPRMGELKYPGCPTTRPALVTQSSRRQRSPLATSTERLTVSDHRLRLRALYSQQRIARFAAVAALGTHADVRAGCRIAGTDPLARRLTGQGPRHWAGQP